MPTLESTPANGGLGEVHGKQYSPAFSLSPELLGQREDVGAIEFLKNLGDVIPECPSTFADLHLRNGGVMTGNQNSLQREVREMMNSGKSVDEVLDWMNQLPENSPLLMNPPMNPEFFSMEQEMHLQLSMRKAQERKTMAG